jgi:succinyl-diaminopimelate desuccinylase
VGYGEAGICSGTLTSPIFYGGHIVAIEGGQAVNAVPSEASAVVRLSGKMLDEEEAEEAGVSFEEYRGDIAKLTARGVAAHASTPEQGENAIGKLVDYLLENDFCSKAEREFLECCKAFYAARMVRLGIACGNDISAC